MGTRRVSDVWLLTGLPQCAQKLPSTASLVSYPAHRWPSAATHGSGAAAKVRPHVFVALFTHGPPISCSFTSMAWFSEASSRRSLRRVSSIETNCGEIGGASMPGGASGLGGEDGGGGELGGLYADSPRMVRSASVTCRSFTSNCSLMSISCCWSSWPTMSRR